MSFADLKRSSSANFEKLNKELSRLNSKGGFQQDERYWEPTVDDAGNGYAVIRFLPAPDGEDYPFVRLWTHGFKGPGGWYIENSLSTINRDDPVLEYNSILWNKSEDNNGPERTQARAQKRRLGYISNIYVVNDPAKPENNGKVFLFKYGKKIFDKLNDLMSPSFEDEKPVDPFNLWEGANFKLKIRKVEGYRNYDKSEFESPSPLLQDDEELEKIYNSEHSLAEIVDPKNFKSYDELKARLNRVLGIEQNEAPKQEARQPIKEEARPELKEEDPPFIPDTKSSYGDTSSDDEDDDESLDAFFKSLADD